MTRLEWMGLIRHQDRVQKLSRAPRPASAAKRAVAESALPSVANPTEIDLPVDRQSFLIISCAHSLHFGAGSTGLDQKQPSCDPFATTLLLRLAACFAGQPAP